EQPHAAASSEEDATEEQHEAGESAGPTVFEGGYDGGDDELGEEDGNGEGEELSEEDAAEQEAYAAVSGEGEGKGEYDRAEVRGPSGTAHMQQRTERAGYERRGGRRGRFGGPRGRGRHMRRAPQRTQMISELLKEGQEILVQIAKEPIGKKGARITS